jgi:hypothetical protein
VEQLRRRHLTETGTLPSVAEAEAELLAQWQRYAGAAGPAAPGPGAVGHGQPTFATSGGLSRSLLDHLTWLQRAGFDAVECFWRLDSRALIGGYVAPGAAMGSGRQ